MNLPIDIVAMPTICGTPRLFSSSNVPLPSYFSACNRQHDYGILGSHIVYKHNLIFANFCQQLFSSGVILVDPISPMLS